MRTLLSRLRRLILREDGPTAVEYAVMLALIVVVCLTAIKTIGTNAKTTFTNVASSLERQLTASARARGHRGSSRVFWLARCTGRPGRDRPSDAHDASELPKIVGLCAAALRSSRGRSDAAIGAFSCEPVEFISFRPPAGPIKLSQGIPTDRA